MEDLKLLEYKIANKLSDTKLKIINAGLEKYKKNSKEKVLCELELIELKGKEKAYIECLEFIRMQIQETEKLLEDLKIFEVNEPETYGLI